MHNLLRSLFWYLIGCISGIIFIMLVLQPQTSCKDELASCQETLNDPHACVSIVVEILEGNYEQTNITK